MSGLTNFLAPYSNLIFSHRNTIIVVLGIILGFTALYALYGHWRVQRLERDVAAARSGAGRPSTARAYATVQPAMDERPAETSGLPPVKGGRTYARNLGSALQKAGMGPPPSAGQPIYSPPIPTGWTPNTAASQPIAPQSPPLYSPASSTWGAPTPSTSWPYPQPAPGPARPGANQSLTPQVPMYQPPAPASQPPQQPSFYPPVYPQAPAPMAPIDQAPPPFAPPAGLPRTPPVPAVQPEPAPHEQGRRGKGKRRRFNLSVLESLEKIVQPRQASQAPAEAAAPAPPATPPAAPPAVTTTAMPMPAWGTAGKAPAPPGQAPAAVVRPGSPAPLPAAEEAPSLPLNFESPPPPSAPAAEPAAEAKPEPKPDPRLSMRSMLFGEEPVPAPPAKEPEAPAALVLEPAELPLKTADVQWPPAELEPVEATSEPAPTEVTDIAQEAAEARAVSEYAWQTAEPVADNHEPVAESHEPAAESHERAAESESQAEAIPWESRSATSAVEEAVAPVEIPQAEEQSAEPTMAEVTGQTPIEPSGAADNSGSAGTMVIIEDDQTVAQYYATLFQGNGYRVEVANDGVSGVDLCTRVQPQVILLDVMMPRQNGILVLQTLRASDETRNTPVVVMSNFSEPTLIKRALQLGALEYVIKTQVEGPALLAAVPRWMNREKAFAA